MVGIQSLGWDLKFAKIERDILLLKKEVAEMKKMQKENMDPLIAVLKQLEGEK
jgi:hypothetical protein